MTILTLPPTEPMIRQCVILAGGLATRLGALSADTPKPVLPVGGRPFLAWLIREFSRFGIDDVVLLTGHLGDRLEMAVKGFVNDLPHSVHIRFSRELKPAGTGGALLEAASLLQEKFLLCNGDSMLACNMADLLAADDTTGVVGRMVVRHLADASRSGVVALDGDRITAFAERPTAAGGGFINAGIYRFDRRILADLAPGCSLERDVLPKLAARGALRAVVGDGYFVDIGVPADFARAQQALPAALHRPALFLDRDGVLNVDRGWVGTRERFEWMPGAIEAVRLATSKGWHVFIVTNQSGVARGFYDETAVRNLHDWMRGQILAAAGTIDDVRYCPFHPEAPLPEYRRVSDWRKPAPGMIEDLIRVWQLDRQRCILVGDQPTDLTAAAAAGIAGHQFTGGNLVDFVAPLLVC